MLDKMERVFINLIKNAIEAMPDGGTLEIASAQNEGDLQITFTDTGIGMTERCPCEAFHSTLYHQSSRHGSWTANLQTYCRSAWRQNISSEHPK